MALCVLAGTRKVTHGTHLADSGAMRTGWYKEGSTWYYLKGSGAMATGWATANGQWSYFENQVQWSQIELFQPVMGKVMSLVRMAILPNRKRFWIQYSRYCQTWRWARIFAKC